MGEAVSWAMVGAVGEAVSEAVGEAVSWAMVGAVGEAVSEGVGETEVGTWVRG